MTYEPTLPTDVFIQPEDASCEKNDDPCDSIPILGDNFAESDDLVCTVRHCEVFQLRITQ